jgi:hypothetical protein
MSSTKSNWLLHTRDIPNQTKEAHLSELLVFTVDEEDVITGYLANLGPLKLFILFLLEYGRPLSTDMAIFKPHRTDHPNPSPSSLQKPFKQLHGIVTRKLIYSPFID